MWAGMAKYGMKEVGRPSFAVEPIGGQTALIIRYGRTSSVNSAETMRVAQYHVPLGAEKARSEEHTSELPSLMRISYAVFCMKKIRNQITNTSPACCLIIEQTYKIY